MIHVQCRSRGNAHTGCAQHYPTALDRITEGSQARALILFCFLTQWVVNCSTASHPSLPPCSPRHPPEKKPRNPCHGHLVSWTSKHITLAIRTPAKGEQPQHSLFQHHFQAFTRPLQNKFLLPLSFQDNDSRQPPQNLCSLPGYTDIPCPCMQNKHHNHNVGNETSANNLLKPIPSRMKQ